MSAAPQDVSAALSSPIRSERGPRVMPAPAPKRTELREQALNRWPGILAALGIDEALLNPAKNHACPACRDGKDRFRYLDKDNGHWICSHCSPPDAGGDGVTLLMAVKGWDFAETARNVRGVLGEIREVRRPEPDKAKIRADIERVWSEAVPLAPGDPVHRYLAVTRGLAGTRFGELENVRYCPSLGYWDGQTRTEHPAMVAMIMTAEGRCATLHRTYLTLDGEKADVETPRKHMTPVADWKGGAVRLHQHSPGQTIVTGEGLESTLALALRHPDAAVWPAMDASHLAAFDPPRDARIVIGADNDESAAGALAAYRLAERLARRGQKWTVEMPSERGTDWADWIRRDVAGRAV